MCVQPYFLKNKGFYISCGHCIQCREQKSIEWSFRISLEAQQYEKNCMITLTYNEEHLPENGTLVRSDVQKFLKRLRKMLYPKKIRFFYCGEYGANFDRPHYHMIIFDYDFEDKYFFKYDKKGHPLYRSPTLESLWKFGFSCINDVTMRSALYSAKYLQKVPDKECKKIPPFVGMSLKPGIGFRSIKEEMLFDDKMYCNGRMRSLPKYFVEVLGRDHVFDVAALKDNRVKFASYYMQYDDDTGTFYYKMPDTYFDEVLDKTLSNIDKVKLKYGALGIDKNGYPVYNVKESTTS